ncbi:SufE family protein [bacterium SCSIO 12741]|nr:SufE family protein [bacterium SCSIO 12741]
MSIQEAQEELIEEFALFEDWMEKYEYIIDLGKDLAPIDEANRMEENLVKGCQSQVWLAADFDGNQLTFQADSDAIITKGIVSMVTRVLSGHTPQEIVDAELFFVDQIGLKEHLSPTRSNGLVSMIKKIKAYALAYSMA